MVENINYITTTASYVHRSNQTILRDGSSQLQKEGLIFHCVSSFCPLFRPSVFRPLFVLFLSRRKQCCFPWSEQAIYSTTIGARQTRHERRLEIGNFRFTFSFFVLFVSCPFCFVGQTERHFIHLY